MLNITTPTFSLHWYQIVTMASRELEAKVAGMVRRDFRVACANARPANEQHALEQLKQQLQLLADDLNDGQPVRVFGAIIPAPEGAAAVLRVLAMPAEDGHFPEAVHKAVFAKFETTVTALHLQANWRAINLIDLAAGTDLQEGVA